MIHGSWNRKLWGNIQMASHALDIDTAMAHLHVWSLLGSWPSGTSIVILRVLVTLATADLADKSRWDA